MSSPAERTHLSPAMLSLLRSAGIAPAALCEVMPLLRPTDRRAVHFLRLADGRQLKARLVSRQQVRRRIQRWNPRLDPELFPRVIAANGRVLLEEWLPGKPLSSVSQDAEAQRESGRTLGKVHGALGVVRVESGDRRLRARLRALQHSLEGLQKIGAVSIDAARAIFHGSLEELPRHAHWGLTHRDFSCDNLLWRQDQACCIDNVDVARGFLEEDLAITFFRWPMPNSQASCFLRGYGQSSVVDAWAANQRFWTTLALVGVATWRFRGGWPEPQASLRQLDLHGECSWAG